MTQGLETRPVRGRVAKQERSERARAAIVEGVITVLAAHGVAGLTHRRVAQASGVSLAATTYYFATKADLIAAAANDLLRLYVDVFGQTPAEADKGGAAGFVDFVSRVAAEGLGRDRVSMHAWYEIMLDGARDPAARRLARSWYDAFDDIWRAQAEAFQMDDPIQAAQTGVDFTVGAMAHGLSLGWTPRQYTDAVTGRLSAEALLGRNAPSAPDPDPAPGGGKAQLTRTRLIETAIRLLAEGGAGTVTYRAVAAGAGLSPAAAVYHFPTIDALLGEAQRTLFARQKGRYREVMRGTYSGLELDTVARLTAGVFQREAAQHGPLNIAGYGLWMEAARTPAVRAHLGSAMADLYRAWRRLLGVLRAPGDTAFEAMCIQFLFIGAQIRVLAGGAAPRDLVRVRRRLRDDVAALGRDRHWLQASAAFRS